MVMDPDIEKIKERLRNKKLDDSVFSKKVPKPKAKAPRWLKHNGGDGGDYGRTYMRDYATPYKTGRS